MVKWISCAWLLRRAFLCSFASVSELKSLPRWRCRFGSVRPGMRNVFSCGSDNGLLCLFHELRPFCIPMKTYSSSNRRLFRHRFVATEWTTRKAWILGEKLACTQSFAAASKQLCIGNSPLSLPLPPSTSRVTRPWQQPLDH